MAAELIAHAQGPFQIDPGALAPAAERRPGQGFRRYVNTEPAFALLDHREAHALAGNRSADIDGRSGIVRANDEMGIAPPFRLPYGANVGHDTGKHD